jgi:double-stranded uracil-DNA glycosylase
VSPTPSQSPKPRSSAVPDVLDTDLRVVFCGINPGRVSAAAAAHFANPRNDFWRLLHSAGFTQRLYAPHEQHEILAEGIGLTNAAYRTTPGSGDLRRSDFADAATRLEVIARELRPAWLAFVGKEAYRGTFGKRPELGMQSRKLDATNLFVLPSTSPANAAVPWEERLRWFRELAERSKPIPRPGVRALILDEENRVLLYCVSAMNDQGVWHTPGGAVEPGETDEQALRRELEEETHATKLEIGPWVWTRRAIWAWRGVVYESREKIAIVHIAPSSIRPDASDSLFMGGSPLQGARFEHRWWTLDELEATREKLAPRRLPSLLRELLRHGPPPEPIDVGL